ncbi:hypothetical protein VTK56DRAFT_9229 [Thermocarpiscus australiensis]
MQLTVAPFLVGLAAAVSTAHQAATGQHTMGFIGCSMAENVATGYVADGGKKMWGPYGTSSMVVQSWTNTNSASWRQLLVTLRDRVQLGHLVRYGLELGLDS